MCAARSPAAHRRCRHDVGRLRISIVTPSYNHAQFIGRTIDSVLGQHGNFELDYRVIDGGSTDGTVGLLESYGPRLTWVSEQDKRQLRRASRLFSRRHHHAAIPHHCTPVVGARS